MLSVLVALVVLLVVAYVIVLHCDTPGAGETAGELHARGDGPRLFVVSVCNDATRQRDWEALWAEVFHKAHHPGRVVLTVGVDMADSVLTPAAPLRVRSAAALAGAAWRTVGRHLVTHGAHGAPWAAALDAAPIAKHVHTQIVPLLNLRADHDVLHVRRGPRYLLHVARLLGWLRRRRGPVRAAARDDDWVLLLPAPGTFTLANNWDDAVLAARGGVMSLLPAGADESQPHLARAHVRADELRDLADLPPDASIVLKAAAVYAEYGADDALAAHLRARARAHSLGASEQAARVLLPSTADDVGGDRQPVVCLESCLARYGVLQRALGPLANRKRYALSVRRGSFVHRLAAHSPAAQRLVSAGRRLARHMGDETRDVVDGGLQMVDSYLGADALLSERHRRRNRAAAARATAVESDVATAALAREANIVPWSGAAWLRGAVFPAADDHGAVLR